ncbi:MAG: T9SS type A sorting domain-containing protein [Melioribacteraceae bacterium]|nr:T9SS type A sorting domain-containing protein [Melioribacteraceae bacterium]MCF8393331.1 T9SS type A sorting domain-containing protein [Melioribacteraceae bacterium]MCF8418896.1 T9SS type A sorting domain-containing protein [Melioribacteraceae bacterium]
MKNFILIFVLTSCIIAQTESNLDYFPQHDGDMWEYFYYDGPLYVDTAQVFNHYDSTDAFGNVYITQTSRYINPIQTPAVPFADTMRYKIDTLNQVWGRVHELDNVIAFKLDAEKGEQWIQKTYYDNDEIMGYAMAKVGSIYEQNYFGKIYTIMDTYYYFTSDTANTQEEYVIYGQDLAKGLGCVWKGGGESPGSVYLIGAVIADVLYGDTTNIITSVEGLIEKNLPKIFELRQNYPNPFNAGTNINFSLSQPANLSLLIYNINGEEVTELITNKYYPPGNYSIYWNAKDKYNQKLTSGVYFYTIFMDSKYVSKGSFRQTKQMILIK